MSIQQIDEARAARGVRSFQALTHEDLCDGSDCPCYREADGITAAVHLDILDWFCKRDPDLVLERLELFHNLNDTPIGGFH